MTENGARRRQIADVFDGALSSCNSAPPGYEVLCELDRGGMAIVYKARQRNPEREVALKVMLPRFADVEEVGIRFQQEGHAML